MKKSTGILWASLIALIVTVSTTRAHAPFKKPFEEKYVKASDDAEFKTTFRKAGCYVCHVKGKPKDWLNGYGLELAKHIPGNAKERLATAKAESRDAYEAENDKLIEDLKKAIKEADSGKTKAGVTFGALFREHKLPTEEGAKSLYADEDSDDEPEQQAASPTKTDDKQ